MRINLISITYSIFRKTSMSDWTSLNAIMRDLSVAQGRDVPAALRTFGNCAPSTAGYEEVTEEEYYTSYGDADYSQPPDFRLIKEMLNRVKPENKELEDDVLLTSSLNPFSVSFEPGKRHRTQIELKKKRARNVAMESILQGLEMNTFEKQIEISKSPMSMFKSKRKLEKKNVIVAPPQANVIVNPVNKSSVYTPTILANVYYNQYKENARVKKEIREDIWTKVEQQMKKKEEERMFLRLEESQCKGDQDSSEEITENNCFPYGIYKVTLEQYRHLSLDSNKDCVVCNVATKHGYRFDGEDC